MPHLDKTGKVWTRVTEMLGVVNCEEQAYHHRKDIRALKAGKITTVNNVTTFAALAGTLVHHDIENWLRELEGLPPIELELDINAEKLLFEIEKVPKLKEELNRKVGRAFNNFIDFWSDYEPEILEIEATLYGNINGIDLKGSADLICAIDIDKLDLAARVKSKPKLTGQKQIIIIDWKSGSTPQASHKTQISAYYLLGMKKIIPRYLDKYDYYKPGGKPRGADVYLGGKNYKFKIFDCDPALFFYNVETYKEAERVPLNRLIGKIGVTLQYCLYCPYRSKCSAFQEGQVELVPSDIE